MAGRRPLTPATGCLRVRTPDYARRRQRLRWRGDLGRRFVFGQDIEDVTGFGPRIIDGPVSFRFRLRHSALPTRGVEDRGHDGDGHGFVARVVSRGQLPCPSAVTFVNVKPVEFSSQFHLAFFLNSDASGPHIG